MTGRGKWLKVRAIVRDIIWLCLGVAGLVWLHPGGAWLSAYWLLFPALCALWLLYVNRRATRVAGTRVAWCGLALSALLYVWCISGSSAHSSFYFLGWRRSGPGWGSLLRCLFLWVNGGVLAGVAVSSHARRFISRRFINGLCGALFGAGLLFVLARFLAETRGQLVYIYDHPSFAFRLWALGQSLPRAIYYNPLWNAGDISTYAVTSGSIPLGIVFWPLWKWLDVSLVYTPVMALSFIILLPLGVVIALRCLRYNWWNACLVGLLALGTCRVFFLHLLRFGTIGFLFSSVFFLPAMALTYRLVWRRRVSVRVGLAAVLCWAIVLSWPGAIWVCPAALAAVAGSVRRLDGRRVVRAVALAALTALILLPLFLSIVRHANVARFMAMTSGELSRGGYVAAWQEGVTRLATLVRGVHPLLLILGMVGWWGMPRGSAKVWSVGWIYFIMLAAWGDAWKPQIIFERFVIHASLLACIPAAYWLGRLGAMQSRLRPLAVCTAACLALAGVWNTGQFYANRSPESYRLLSPPMQELIEWIRTETPPNGRIAFMGATLHGYGAGQVALLPVLCEREMMACDYYAFSPHKVGYDFPPRQWRCDGEAIADYWALNGVTHVVTYHRKWKAFLRSRPKTYHEEAGFMQTSLEMSVFSTGVEASRLQQGKGRVASRINGLTLTWEGDGRDAVLRYLWYPELRADGATVYPVSVAPGMNFIGVTRTDMRPSTEIVF